MDVQVIVENLKIANLNSRQPFMAAIDLQA